jgi:hypothetical protein
VWIVITAGAQKMHGMWYVDTDSTAPVAKSFSFSCTMRLLRYCDSAQMSVTGFCGRPSGTVPRALATHRSSADTPVMSQVKPNSAFRNAVNDETTRESGTPDEDDAFTRGGSSPARGCRSSAGTLMSVSMREYLDVGNAMPTPM